MEIMNSLDNNNKLELSNFSVTCSLPNGDLFICGGHDEKDNMALDNARII